MCYYLKYIIFCINFLVSKMKPWRRISLLSILLDHTTGRRQNNYVIESRDEIICRTRLLTVHERIKNDCSFLAYVGTWYDNSSRGSNSLFWRYYHDIEFLDTVDANKNLKSIFKTIFLSTRPYLGRTFEQTKIYDRKGHQHYWNSINIIFALHCPIYITRWSSYKMNYVRNRLLKVHQAMTRLTRHILVKYE